MCLLKVRAAARLLGPGRTSSRLTTSRSVAALATGAGESSGPLNRRRALLAAGGAALAGGLTPPTSRPAIAAAAGKKIDVQRLLDEVTWPPTPPFEGDDFKRFDESDDAFFYDSPRFVTHIDDLAIEAYRSFLASDIFPSSGSGASILDLCSSWVSHYPKRYSAARVVGVGMNEAELARNAALSEFAVRDLNKDPTLPYEAGSFDVITNCVSVDYLSRPFEVFAEMHRVCKPGGVAVCAFSNRMFPTKAVAVWTGTGDEDHARIIGSFFHYAPADGWEMPQGKDITTRPFIGLSGDPMYVVWARKKK